MIIRKHHNKLRLNGYHDFHRATEIHKTLPLHIVSLWSAVFLGIQNLMHQFYGVNFWEKCIVVGYMSPIIYATAFSALESLALSVTHISYISEIFFVRINEIVKRQEKLFFYCRSSCEL